MGLKLTLPKDKNHLYMDFVDAYWAVADLSYGTTNCQFILRAYPSRDAKLKDLSIVENPSIGYGSAKYTVVDSWIYEWNGIFPIVDIFPSGIPLDSDAQKTAIYNWIKSYTQLPFEDVLEA